ncbi:hypothetical protein DL96DRAFT_1731200 [Flagelloscypha sp. PMI_526]|nr:hypothetical protein DL96DRAFT_1731200 [Flagelloscypha sp. PMI_526]
MFLDLPPEVVLRIYSYLDLPELACMAQVSPLYAALASDPALHRNRLKIVAPSRIRHSLFGHSPQGLALRPTFGELVHRNVARGLMIESRWRRGEYLYTQGVLRGPNGAREAADLLELWLGFFDSESETAACPFIPLQAAGILPEEYTMTVSRSLLPTLRQLKWSFRKDKLAQGLRKGSGA